jgi:anti-sigma factor RsiW
MTKPISHREAFEILPWYVNGTLGADEQATVARHVRDCLPCRIALREQTRLESLLKRQPTVPLSAEPSFDRLMKAIDGTARRRSWRPRFLLPSLAFLSVPGRAAAVAVALAALGLALLFGIVMREAPRDAAFVTTTEPSTSPVELDIIFADGISEAELRAVIRDIDGVIVDGPSNIGRYRVRLAGREGAPGEIEAALTSLRADPRVRLASRAYIVENAP